MENHDFELENEGRLHDGVQRLLDRLQECEEDHENRFSPSIVMVPNTLRDHSEKSFNPREVSIGPLHDYIDCGMQKECSLIKLLSHISFPKENILKSLDLDNAGITFKPARNPKWLMGMDVKISRFSCCFSWWCCKPILSMPVLYVHDFTELVLRNLLAYERQSSQTSKFIASYAYAMDMLVTTQEDVAKLIDSKVLVNSMGSNEEAAKMINSICKEVAWEHSFYGDQWENLNKYYAKVILDEIDLFWRKFDLNPSLVNEDEGVDIDAQLDRVIQHIKLQPNPVKKSMMSKEPPVDHQDPADQPPPPAHHVVVRQPRLHPVDATILRYLIGSVRDLSGRVDRLEGMMRWMMERMAASAGMDVPVFPGPGHHEDPQDLGGHA
ncbi:hypothetical protein R6Q59_027335 [Mikania micrantha]